MGLVWVFFLINAHQNVNQKQIRSVHFHPSLFTRLLSSIFQGSTSTRPFTPDILTVVHISVIYIHLSACTHMHTHTHRHMHIHTCTCTHTHMHTRTHAHTHTCIQTCIHTTEISPECINVCMFLNSCISIWLHKAAWIAANFYVVWFHPNPLPLSVIFLLWHVSAPDIMGHCCVVFLRGGLRDEIIHGMARHTHLCSCRLWVAWPP